MEYFEVIVLSLITTITVIFVAVAIYHIYYSPRNLKTTETLPLGREKEIDQLSRHILKGESAAIVGIFDQENRDMLNALRTPALYGELYGQAAQKLIFAYVDIVTFVDPQAKQ